MPHSAKFDASCGRGGESPDSTKASYAARQYRDNGGYQLHFCSCVVVRYELQDEAIDLYSLYKG